MKQYIFGRRASVACTDTITQTKEGRVKLRNPTYSVSDEVDSLVDTSEGGNIDGLSADDTGTADTGGVLTRTRVHDGLHEDLQGVLVGEEVDDVEGVLGNADSQQLLA